MVGGDSMEQRLFWRLGALCCKWQPHNFAHPIWKLQWFWATHRPMRIFDVRDFDRLVTDKVKPLFGEMIDATS
jgi:hypothetical protein